MKANLSKVLALLMVLVLVAGMFAGCAQQPAQTTTDKSGNETNTTETETDTTTETETTETRPNRVIYGSTTGLSGDLGNAWWTNNADDKTLRDLIDDYSTVSYNQDGALVMNATTAASIDSVMNEDGTKTFTVKINEGLVYNNGEPITAADYVAYDLVAFSPAALEAGAKVTTDIVVGAADYQARTMCPTTMI